MKNTRGIRAQSGDSRGKVRAEDPGLSVSENLFCGNQ